MHSHSAESPLHHLEQFQLLQSYHMLPSQLTLCIQARHWKKYAEVEMAAGSTQQVKTIFSRCLLSCPSVDLWQTYLTFIQKVTPLAQPKAAEVLKYCAQC